VEPFEIATGVFVTPGRYDFHGIQSQYNMGPQRRITGRISVAAGSFYGGTRNEVGYQGRVEINSQFSVEPRLSVNWVNLPGGRFTARLLSTRATYTLTTRMATSALVQYNSSNNTVSSNVRFRWEYRPGSDLFVVYSDGRETGSAHLAGLQNQSFVIKMTRLFRL